MLNRSIFYFKMEKLCGGGGGSSWTTGATNVTHTQGYSSADGNGAIAITFQ